MKQMPDTPSRLGQAQWTQ